jgi:hypothetical protein
LLWLAAAVTMAACPMLLSDPAMWHYLLDPELLALIVVIGAQYSWLQVSLLRAHYDRIRRPNRARGDSTTAAIDAAHLPRSA